MELFTHLADEETNLPVDSVYLLTQGLYACTVPSATCHLLPVEMQDLPSLPMV